MKQQSPLVRNLFACLLAFSLFQSCTKVNEATEIGGDLTPAVDNVNTFDTTLEVLTYNQPFENGDSVRSISFETHFIGNITEDPLFGKTSASLFLQLMPETIKTPFAFPNKDSLIEVDSVVLVLGARSVYGDTTRPQRVQVFEIAQNSPFKSDSLYLIHTNNGFTYNNAISNVQELLPSTLNDSVTLFREKAVNQLRLRLNNDFGRRLLHYDSTNAYKSNADFKTFFKGFAVVPQNGAGNALIGVSLPDTNTKLAFYYRYRKSGQPDTAVTYFRFIQFPVGSSVAGDAFTAVANHIQRDRSGSEFAAVAGDANADQLLYIQNAPGTYARIRVPGLKGLGNRVVHRAELQVQQVPDPLASRFPPSNNLYLDAYDTAAKVYRTIPLDVAINQNGQVTNAAGFGMAAKAGTGPNGPISVWRFDISRYVQQVVNGSMPVYELRLSSPFFLSTLFGTGSTAQGVFVNPVFAAGRVRVGGGNHPTQPMRLRIIYSKI